MQTKRTQDVLAGFNWIEALHSRVLMDVKALGQKFRKVVRKHCTRKEGI